MKLFESKNSVKIQIIRVSDYSVGHGLIDLNKFEKVQIIVSAGFNRLYECESAVQFLK